MGESHRVGCSLPRECRQAGWDKEARDRRVRMHHLCSRNSGVGRATSKPCSQRPLWILPLPLYPHDLASDLPSGSPGFLFSHKDVCLCSDWHRRGPWWLLFLASEPQELRLLVSEQLSIHWYTPSCIYTPAPCKTLKM